jgi:hypothetical protein
MVQNVYSQDCIGNQSCPSGYNCINSDCISTISSSNIHNYQSSIWTPKGYSGITSSTGITGITGTAGSTGYYMGFQGNLSATRYMDITLNKLYFRNSILNRAINIEIINDLYENYKNVELEKFYIIIDYVNKMINNQYLPFLLVDQFNGSFIMKDDKFYIDNILMNLYMNILNFMFGIMKVINVTEYESYKEMLKSNDSTNVNIVLEILENIYNKNYYNG